MVATWQHSAGAARQTSEQVQKKVARSSLLSLGSAEWGWLTVARGRPVQQGTLSHPQLSIQQMTGMPPCPSCGNQKCLQTLPGVPEGQISPRGETGGLHKDSGALPCSPKGKPLASSVSVSAWGVPSLSLVAYSPSRLGKSGLE